MSLFTYWSLLSLLFLGALFGMLDTETDLRLRSDIQDTLTSMFQTLAPHNLTHWLGLCRDVLSAAKNMKRNASSEPQAKNSKKGKIKLGVGAMNG